MAATLDNSSRHWWSMKAHTAPGPEYASEKPKSKSKTLNSLFGRKSKKQSPPLAIPDPPLPIQNIPPEDTQSFANRPPSKSVSSTRSRTDSLEPRTPSDFHHNPARNSLLTLSDSDPFASGRRIAVVSSPHPPSDPTRLSAYSNSSSGAGEYIYQKNSDGHPRASLASSSYSQYQAGGPESPNPVPLSPSLPSPNAFQGKLLTKRSDTALNSNKGQPSSHFAISGTSGSNPSSRPLTRPRGLTDNGGTTQKSGFFMERFNPTNSASLSSKLIASEQPASPTRSPSSRRPSNASSTLSRPITSPRVVIRQASVQGLSKPVPPPTQRLPAPPQSPTDASKAGRILQLPPIRPPRCLHSNSTASSGISFTSSMLESDAFPTDAFPSPPISPPLARPRRISDRSPLSCPTADVDNDKVQSTERSKASLPPLTPPTLKKAISHQSLLKRGPLFSVSSSQTSASPPSRDQEKESDKDKEKTPHKLRVFPHPRLPIPPIPLKHSNPSVSTLIETPPQEQKRVSVGSVRKRLFSGSSLRRPSTSQSVKDEDSQSVLSWKSEQDLYINTSFFKPWISTQSSGPSFWEEGSPTTAPNSPTRPTGPDVYANEPASPTLGRYEPTRAAPPFSFSSPTLAGCSRQRAFSVRSSSTVASTECDDESVLSRISPRSHTSIQSRFQRSNTITTASRTRAGSNSQNSKHDSALHVNSVGIRPRTATSPGAPRNSPDRPSTAQHALNTGVHLSSAAAVERAFSYATSSESPPPDMTSLPPPPRRNRPRPVITPQAEEPLRPSASISSSLSSLPPPAPSPVSVPSSVPTPQHTVISLQPPPRRTPRLKISFEKTIHQRSIMKKPSFLDFGHDDDADDLAEDRDTLDNQEDVVALFDEPRSRVSSIRRVEEENRSRPTFSRTNSTRNSPAVADLKSPPRVSESFLDFARESFDSTRSDS